MNDVMQFHLEYFDGPLDLLLHLIKDSKIDIETVFLSEVTSQYLDYMSELDRIDIELQAEFLSVASTLLEIKSKALLPRYEVIGIDEDEDADDLLKRLEEYKMFKDVSKTLKDIEEVGKLYKERDDSTLVSKVVFLESDLDKLMSAFTKMLMVATDDTRREKMVEKVIPKDVVTVEKQRVKLRATLKDRGKVTFFSLFDKTVTKIELVVTLLAILEMIKNQEITIRQQKEFDDIDIELI